MSDVEPRARTTDPGTSHAAARSMRDAASAQRAKLLGAVRGSGLFGLTCAEADSQLGWRETSAGRRMSELRELGLVHDSGMLRKTPSGRQAIVWRAS